MGDPFHLSKTGYRSLTQEDKIQTSLLAGLSPPLLLFCTELRNTVHWKMLSANAEKRAIIQRVQINRAQKILHYFWKRMVMLENESNSVGVHPSVPYSEIKAAHLKNYMFQFFVVIQLILVL